ncbi:MAG: hypothetical protein IPH44_15075 [Myxococcales bacterium]|nr:hypothetical protein [Myxococcales bacterium]MBP6848253.1 hypothetical protein [Kofleriaceae bacterium]
MVLRRVLLGVIAVSLAACGGGGGANPVDAPDTPIDAAVPVDAPVDAFIIPVLRNPVATPDAELATQAAALLGQGGPMRCNQCHAITRDRLRSWETESSSAVTSCLTNTMPMTQAEGAAIVDCLRAAPGVATSGWPPDHLGIYATAARLDWFRYVFNLAFGTTEGPTQLAMFQAEAAMPRGAATEYTQAEFDIVAEWFARGLPMIDVVIPADPPPTQCTTNITSEVATHVATMATQGWRAVNRGNGILMFGCAGAATARDCLGTYPAASDNAFSNTWEGALPGQRIRVLRTNNYASSYWTRSSADGRYVSHGGASVASQTYRSTVIDLSRDAEIPAAALYDPGFFADNSGFVLQGGSAKFCEQSLLATNPAMIAFNEPQCRTTTAVGLYQHLGAVHNGDYWTVDGQFTNDNGGHNATLSDPSATFSQTATIDLTPMVHTGNQFVPKPGVRKSVTREGDVIISPSARLLVSRVSAGGGQSLFLMRKIVATPNGTSYDIQIPEIARYCVRGAKPAISFDERWMVWHHYVEANDWMALGYASATDPGFVALRTSGAANLFVMDIATGVIRRVTTMAPGQYALYPHFRSDGWIYFIVRDSANNREYIAASDAALMLETQ